MFLDLTPVICFQSSSRAKQISNCDIGHPLIMFLIFNHYASSVLTLSMMLAFGYICYYLNLVTRHFYYIDLKKSEINNFLNQLL